MGDIFRVGNDDGTAASLFAVALALFTAMGVQRGRGECMLRLDNISSEEGSVLWAVNSAKGRSTISMVITTETGRCYHYPTCDSDRRGDVLERNQNGQARLAHLNVLSGTLGQSDAEMSDEDLHLDTSEALIPVNM
ncbi:hypothetical protein B0H16DRAFT_1453867 [Mycena metata]|uniref:Uncharacterized protein n=1 Tax=Mycena metata TaxID=1033252 RepID=A0AAD7JKN1_9AGAR|nr:hypothetical protein B0H16DRAFT_1453867 [Mycena metata]